ncbi:MAG: S8 family serine peptidase [Bacteroidetes bacterium]|nr:S8 family serine peptidase [Bacteroidota bacterium]
MNNTGQFGGTIGDDIDIVNAWGIATGSSSVKVAILDCFGSASQFSHPDISFYGTHDATGTGFNTNGLSGEAYGICCAGIIAAQGNNSLGIAGVAYGCNVLAVKIGTITSGTSWSATGNSISNGITWAYQNADVISNSNSFGSSSSLIDNAISNSITLGRAGLGTPFFSRMEITIHQALVILLQIQIL